jgi:hypothetical protein
MLSNQTVDETLSFTKLRVKAFSCNQLQNKASFFSFLYELFQSYFTFDDDDIYIYIYCLLVQSVELQWKGNHSLECILQKELDLWKQQQRGR